MYIQHVLGPRILVRNQSLIRLADPLPEAGCCQRLADCCCQCCHTPTHQPHVERITIRDVPAGCSTAGDPRTLLLATATSPAQPLVLACAAESTTCRHSLMPHTDAAAASSEGVQHACNTGEVAMHASNGGMAAAALQAPRRHQPDCRLHHTALHCSPPPLKQPPRCGPPHQGCRTGDYSHACRLTTLALSPHTTLCTLNGGQQQHTPWFDQCHRCGAIHPAQCTPHRHAAHTFTTHQGHVASCSSEPMWLHPDAAWTHSHTPCSTLPYPHQQRKTPLHVTHRAPPVNTPVWKNQRTLRAVTQVTQVHPLPQTTTADKPGPSGPANSALRPPWYANILTL